METDAVHLQLDTTHVNSTGESLKPRLLLPGPAVFTDSVFSEISKKPHVHERMISHSNMQTHTYKTHNYDTEKALERGIEIKK